MSSVGVDETFAAEFVKAYDVKCITVWNHIFDNWKHIGKAFLIFNWVNEGIIDRTVQSLT